MKQIAKGTLMVISLIILLKVIPIPEVIEEKAEVITNNIINTVSSRNKNEVRKPTDKQIIQKQYEIGLKTNLRTISNISAEEYNKMLKGTSLYGIGNAIYKAEQTYKVNGLYIMGLACLESAYGNSKYAKDRNNLFGYQAYDSNPDKAKSFKSKEECIMFVTEKLSKNYLSKGGSYFEGYTAKDIDKHYCTDKQHANKIIKIIKKLERKL